MIMSPRLIEKCEAKNRKDCKRVEGYNGDRQNDPERNLPTWRYRSVI
jgi:hypothetical protein